MTSEPAWRIDPIVADVPAALLAATQAAFDALATDPTPRLRWYRSTTTAVVAGRGQRRVDLTGASVPVVERSTGGGAVLLDPTLLSCDVLVPPTHPLAGGELDPMTAFDRVGRAWCDALTELGVGGLWLHTGPATAMRRGGARERLLAEICFATRGRGEVVQGQRKLVGLAQRRRRTGVLIQCGMLRRWQPGALLAALNADPDDHAIAAAAIGLDDASASPPDDAAVADAVSTRLAGWTFAGASGVTQPAGRSEGQG